ncbi:MAG: putative aspartyl aminopeptidase [Chlamydiales bacterium]|nr:putative aspartyl aminopeptidase [Chlamydiales bacterium]
MGRDEEIHHFLNFLGKAPSPWHAVEEIKLELVKLGYTALEEGQLWSLTPGGKYFVARDGASIAAFTLPLGKLDSALLLAAHTDSPSFKLRPNPQVSKEGVVFLGVEVYGHPIASSWLNRDLGIAGKVAFINAQGHFQSALVNLDEHPCLFAQLPVHLDRKVNESGPTFHLENHLYLLAGLQEADSPPFLDTILKEKIGCQKLLAHDLFVYPLEKARRVGYQGQMIASYRLDNLASTYAALRALADESEPLDTTLKMAIFWDHEEIGSGTSRGAESPFAHDLLERISFLLDLDQEEFFCLKRNALCLSLDMAHAYHPLYKDRYQGEHLVHLKKGPALKYHANQRYATDVHSSALLLVVKEFNPVSLQSFVTRGDMPCGSTIGPLFAAKTGIRTVDLGIPQLSMHSAREVIAIQDYLTFKQFIESALFNSEELAKGQKNI